MEITAGLVKELRERTGAGMMECKKALVETAGDIEAAVDLMRKSGLAKADKKAGRIAAEGTVALALSADQKTAALAEVNCETDFVAKGDEFQAFARAVAATVLRSRPADVDALLGLPLEGCGETTVETRRRELVAKIGENMTVRRFRLMASAGGTLGVYLHGTRVGVLVDMAGGDQTLAKDIAMHVAASRPVCLDEAEVPADLLAREREIFAAQAAESGKPADIVEKMVAGRVKKFVAEVTLLGQPFVKNPDIHVARHLSDHKARVLAFERFTVGEGLEKRSENFAAEVMAQVSGSR